MFLKFSMLTFLLPVFLVDVRDRSPAFAGLVIASQRFLAPSSLWVRGRLALIGRPTQWITLGTGMMGLALISIVLVPSASLILVSAIVYGAADGLMGVFTNSFVTSATNPKHRAIVCRGHGRSPQLCQVLSASAVRCACSGHQYQNLIRADRAYLPSRQPFLRWHFAA